MRRAFLRAAARTGLGVLLLPLAASAPVSGGRRVPAVLARDLRNGWGVCGRPGIDASHEAYAAMMDQIGTRDLRTDLMQGGRSALDRLLALRAAMVAAGISDPAPKVTALVGAYLNDRSTTWAAQRRALLDMAPSGLLRAIEGPNEINNREVGGGTHGTGDHADRTGEAEYPGNFRAWAAAIAAFRREHAAALGSVTLVAPSIASGRRADYARLPDVSDLVEAGNVHFYAGQGRQPGYTMAENPFVGYFTNILAWAQAAQKPAGPMWLTEAGATTSGNYARDGLSQAKYVANQFFDLFAAGGQRLFFYHLVDGSGAAGDIEGNFGLFRRDGTPKPAAVLLGHLKHLLSIGLFEDPRNARDDKAFTPAYDASALTVSGLRDAGPSGGTLVMHKSDGSTMIAIWNEPVIDDGKGRSLSPGPVTVTVGFGSVQTYSIHDLLDPAPLTGTTPSGRQFATGPATTVSLRGHPVLVELRPPPG